MLAHASLLAQVRPADTSIVSAFRAEINTELTLINVCNTTAVASAFSIYHNGAGVPTFTDEEALYRARFISANTTFSLALRYAGGITLAPGDYLGVQTDTALSTTFSIYGITAQLAGQNYG